MKQLSSISIFLKIYIFDMKEKDIFTTLFSSISVECGIYQWNTVGVEVILKYFFVTLRIHFKQKESSY